MRCEMYKVIVWGTRTEYDYFFKWFEVEILKGNMLINAVVFNETNLFKCIDKYSVIGIEKIQYMDYDYIIDMNQNARSQIIKIMEILNISRDKVIPARVFGQPFFDLKRWIQVKEKNISIISSHCWGGYAYNTLGMEFKSPFINLYLDNDNFFKILKDIPGYMSQPLEFIGENYEENLKRNYPIINIGDATLHFNHYTDYKEAVTVWNRRKERLNYRNLFIEMTANTEEDIQRFVALPYEQKVCFTMIPCNEKNVISIQNPYLKRIYGENAWQYAIGVVMKSFEESKRYDLLKLLNCEQDYFRAEDC